MELLFLKGDIMLSKCILQEMISKALNLDIRDILRIPKEAISDILLINIEINLALEINYID